MSGDKARLRTCVLGVKGSRVLQGGFRGLGFRVFFVNAMRACTMHALAPALPGLAGF